MPLACRSSRHVNNRCWTRCSTMADIPVICLDILSSDVSTPSSESSKSSVVAETTRPPPSRAGQPKTARKQYSSCDACVCIWFGAFASFLMGFPSVFERSNAFGMKVPPVASHVLRRVSPALMHLRMSMPMAKGRGSRSLVSNLEPWYPHQHPLRLH